MELQATIFRNVVYVWDLLAMSEVKIVDKTSQSIGEDDVHNSYTNGKKLLKTYTAAKPSNRQIYIAIDYP